MTALKDMAPEVAAGKIRHFGESLTIPEGMDIDQAIQLLEYRKKYEKEEVQISESFDTFPLDGAVQLDCVLTERYGWAPAEATYSMFGKNPPQLLSIEVSPGVFKQVPWGKFALPNIQGHIFTDTADKDGRKVFQITAKVLRQCEKAVQELFSAVRERIKTHSIYRGQAIRLRFRDDDGDVLAMPEPKFLDTSDIDETQLVYSKDVMNSVKTNLFTPITRVHDCIANGMKVKRGVLLGGPFGTGKTLAAAIASKLAVKAGITYIYVPRADELADAILFAKMYQSPAAVVFCEDIDRALDGVRNVKMDDLLNTIDGIDSKTANIIVVLTTNFLEQINKAMLRPGRLDAVIDVQPPDAEAVGRLLRVYGREHIAADTDLTEIGRVLEGQIPAIIAEVVKRAKLSQLSLQEPGTMVNVLSEAALLEAAKTMTAQIKLLKTEDPPVARPMEAQIGDIVDARTARMAKRVNELHERVCG